MTLSGAQVADLMARHGLHPSRALGQNFVIDPNTVRRIARLAGVGPGDRVVEIGAGLGSLTLALLETGADVLTVEFDRHLLPVLEELVVPRGARLVHGDALELDWVALLVDAPWVLVANLPYNVAAVVVADLLDEVPAISRMLIMVQREVGERMAAHVGSPAYGALSVKIAYWAEASPVGRVPASVFLPRPKVESCLVAIERRDVPAVDPAVVDAAWLFRMVKAGFAQRRKMLRRSLADLVGPEELNEAFDAAGVRPQARAEELDVHAWGRLAACATPR